MNKFDNEILKLRQYTKKLYKVSGQFNLYISLCYDKYNMDIARLKAEIEQIKNNCYGN